VTANNSKGFLAVTGSQQGEDDGNDGNDAIPATFSKKEEGEGV